MPTDNTNALLDFTRKIEELANQPSSVTIDLTCRPVTKRKPPHYINAHIISLSTKTSVNMHFTPIGAPQFICVHECISITFSRPSSLRLRNTLDAARRIPVIPPFGAVRWLGAITPYPSTTYRRSKSGKEMRVPERIYIPRIVWNPSSELFWDTLLIYGILHQAPIASVRAANPEDNTITILTLPSLNIYSIPDITVNPLSALLKL